MENEIMNNNEELMEVEVETTMEEVETNGSNAGLIIVGVGAVTALGVLAYKKLVKPALAKRKAKKEQLKNQDNIVDIVDYTEEIIEDDEDSDDN